MLQDFFFQNIELSILMGLFVFELALLPIVKHPYRREKIIGWLMITAFLSLLLINIYTQISGIVLITIFACREFWWLVKNDTIRFRIVVSVPFYALLGVFLCFLYLFPSEFFYFFILVSLSDIVAYYVGTLLPWKKGFTSISPNKSLSGVIAQAVFLWALITLPIYYAHPIPASIVIGMFIGCMGPGGDLLESYFKRRAGVKDTANYIPGHGGILDRIDSSLLIIVAMFVLYAIG